MQYRKYVTIGKVSATFVDWRQLNRPDVRRQRQTGQDSLNDQATVGGLGIEPPISTKARTP